MKKYMSAATAPPQLRSCQKVFAEQGYEVVDLE